MTAREIREQIQYQLNQRDQNTQSYIDTVYNIEHMVIKAQEQVKNIAYEPVLATVIAKKIIEALDDYGRKTHSVEYGLPIDPDFNDWTSEKSKDMINIVTDIINAR